MTLLRFSFKIEGFPLDKVFLYYFTVSSPLGFYLFIFWGIYKRKNTVLARIPRKYRLLNSCSFNKSTFKTSPSITWLLITIGSEELSLVSLFPRGYDLLKDFSRKAWTSNRSFIQSNIFEKCSFFIETKSSNSRSKKTDPSTPSVSRKKGKN